MSDQRAVTDHAQTLSEDGIVVVEDYLDGGTCDDIREAVEARLEADDFATARPDDGFNDHAAREEPVLKRRSGDTDDGMLDIFNMDLAVDELREFKQDPFVAGVVNGATDVEYTPDTANIYVNRSVTETRDYHADTYAGKFKSFVYLTDVPDRSYGPFSYIRGSHSSSGIKRKASQLVNKVRDTPSTDAVFYDDSDAAVCTAPKGTLIVADQTGYHRGIPQEEGKERMLTMTSYTPDDR